MCVLAGAGGGLPEGAAATVLDAAHLACEERAHSNSYRGHAVPTPAGYVLEWKARPGELLLPVYAPVGAGAGDAVRVAGAVMRGDAAGTARTFVAHADLMAVGPVRVIVLPAATDMSAGVAAAGGESGASGGGGPLYVFPPYAIGGWTISAQNSVYQDSNYSVAVGRVPDAQPSQVDTLWVALTDESGSSVEAVKVVDFAPAELEAGYDNVLATGDHELESGHTLCIRIFDHEPEPEELGTGGLLWDSN